MSRPAVVMTIAILVLGVGCAKQPATMTTASAPAPAGTSSSSTATPTAAAPSSTVSARSSAPVGDTTRAAARPSPTDFRAVSDLVDVHFEFDSADLRPDAMRTLEANARLLNARSDTLVLVEGHCDERGTTEYNVALGERRARAAVNALVARGVDARRITLVSFGEDKPECRERTEACWAKNRRAHFKVKPR